MVESGLKMSSSSAIGDLEGIIHLLNRLHSDIDLEINCMENQKQLTAKNESGARGIPYISNSGSGISLDGQGSEDFGDGDVADISASPSVSTDSLDKLDDPNDGAGLKRRNQNDSPYKVRPNEAVVRKLPLLISAPGIPIRFPEGTHSRKPDVVPNINHSQQRKAKCKKVYPREATNKSHTLLGYFKHSVEDKESDYEDVWDSKPAWPTTSSDRSVIQPMASNQGNDSSVFLKRNELQNSEYELKPENCDNKPLRSNKLECWNEIDNLVCENSCEDRYRSNGRRKESHINCLSRTVMSTDDVKLDKYSLDKIQKEARLSEEYLNVQMGKPGVRDTYASMRSNSKTLQTRYLMSKEFEEKTRSLLFKESLARDRSGLETNRALEKDMSHLFLKETRHCEGGVLNCEGGVLNCEGGVLNCEGGVLNSAYESARNLCKSRLSVCTNYSLPWDEKTEAWTELLEQELDSDRVAEYSNYFASGLRELLSSDVTHEALGLPQHLPSTALFSPGPSPFHDLNQNNYNFPDNCTPRSPPSELPPTCKTCLSRKSSQRSEPIYENLPHCSPCNSIHATSSHSSQRTLPRPICGTGMLGSMRRKGSLQSSFRENTLYSNSITEDDPTGTATPERQEPRCFASARNSFYNDTDDGVDDEEYFGIPTNMKRGKDVIPPADDQASMRHRSRQSSECHDCSADGSKMDHIARACGLRDSNQNIEVQSSSRIQLFADKTSHALPDPQICNYVTSLASRNDVCLGRMVQCFVECTQEGLETHPRNVIRNVRLFLNGLKNYLKNWADTDFTIFIGVNYSPFRFDFTGESLEVLDASLESALQNCIVASLKEHIFELFNRRNRRQSQWLYDGIKIAETKSATELGVRAEITPALEAHFATASRFLTKFHESDLPLSKFENILNAAFVIYDSISITENQRGWTNGGPSLEGIQRYDFLSAVMYLISRHGRSLLDTEASLEFVHGLIPSSYLTSENLFILDTFKSAILILQKIGKCWEHAT